MLEPKNNTPAVQQPGNKAIAQVDYLAGQIEKIKPELAKSLPAHISPDKFVRTAITVLRNNPDLQKCSGVSILSSLGKAAADGLMPDNREAAIVKFGEVAQYMPMVKGILKMIRNSGDVASVQPDVVYTNDTFKYWKDENGTHLHHEPLLDGERGDFKLAYSIAKMKDGEVIITLMTKAEVEKVRNSSRSKNSGPWTQWYDEMAKKTVLRRQAKILPSSTDLENIFKHDDEMYNLNGPTTGEDKPEVPGKEKNKPNKLKDKILGKKEKDVTSSAQAVTNDALLPQDSDPTQEDPPPLAEDIIDAAVPNQDPGTVVQEEDPI